jgi:hypothetical protein
VAGHLYGADTITAGKSFELPGDFRLRGGTDSGTPCNLCGNLLLNLQAGREKWQFTYRFPAKLP